MKQPYRKSKASPAGAAAALMAAGGVEGTYGPITHWQGKNAKSMTRDYLRSLAKPGKYKAKAPLTKRSRAQADPLGGSVSKFTCMRPKKKLGNTDKLTSIQPYVDNSAGRITSLIGKQEGALIQTNFNPGDIVNLFNSALGGTAGKSTKMLLKSVVAESFLTNMENVPLNYTIYDILPKRDGNGTVVDPISAFRAGFADSGGGAAANYLVPGVDPYMDPRFNEYFRIVERTTGTLLPGNVHTHKVYYEPNYIISNEVSTWTVDFIKALTHFTMIIIHGTPENDSTTKTQVSLSAANISYVTKRKLTGKMLWLAAQAMTATNNLPLSFTVGAEILNEFTGVAQAENVA